VFRASLFSFSDFGFLILDFSLMRGQLHHVEIYVSDLARSTEFWSWFLERFGYAIYQKWPKGISWKLGETYLVFVQTEEKYLNPPYHRCHTGLNHLAFWADSRAEVDELHNELRKRGITILYEDKHPDASLREPYALYFEDPDRIKVEVVARG
jgi:catechol 2,3-dioxygenase-like lactoylglutathione lyase family enzyme